MREVVRPCSRRLHGCPIEVLDDLAASPDVAAMDRDRCTKAFGVLRNAAASTHIHLLDPSGAEVCSVRGPDTGTDPLEVGPWFGRVLAGESPVLDGPFVDSIGRQPAILLAVAAPATAGGAGALAAVSYTGEPPPEIPRRAPEGTVVVAVDAERRLVIARSAGAAARLGMRTTGTPFATPAPSRAVRDVDGQQRYFVEATGAYFGWHVCAGLERDVALRPARDELRNGVLIGALTIALVA